MKYLILGAGAAGLTFAEALLKKGIDDFLILEKEEEAGGLCRSADVDNGPFDIGGGHFLDKRNPFVMDFIFSFLPEEEWDTYERDSKIDIKNNIINSPIEANIWQLDIDTQVEYLKSIAKAGCNTGEPMPEHFTEWIYWKLGERIAEDYMIPYNQKMFGEDLDSLGTNWLNKLPNVSFEETLRSCLERKAFGKQPAHAVFLYPKKYGYGEVWRRMASDLGDRLLTGIAAETLDMENHRVNDCFNAEIIVNTAPWTHFKEIKGFSDRAFSGIGALRHCGIVTEYEEKNIDTKAQWIYYPDSELPYHRILVRHNFCPGARGYWTETNTSRYRDNPDKTAFKNEYAYPLNTIGKEEKIALILKEAEAHGVYGLGRWGEWQHYNSDIVVERSFALAEKLEGKQTVKKREALK